MCEVAVWDKTLNCFHLDGRVKLENGVLEPIGKDYTVHQYIGLKDMGNKKIYADSSIVEFGYKVGNASHIGYFFYSNKDLSYKLKILSKKFNNEEWLYCSSMADFIIIDTIQENKLSLIKEIKK